MDSKVSELSNELRLRGFDGERVKAMNQDTIENLKKTQLELEKKETKLEVLFFFTSFLLSMLFCTRQGFSILFVQKSQTIILVLT